MFFVVKCYVQPRACCNNHNINPLYGQIKTAEQGIVIQQYDDWYTGRWWVGGYIWYSEEGPGRAAAPPSPLLAVPNVTAHQSTASVPTSARLILLKVAINIIIIIIIIIIRCGTISTYAH